MTDRELTDLESNVASVVAGGLPFARVRADLLADLLAIAKAAEADAWVPVAERLPEADPESLPSCGTAYSHPVLALVGDDMYPVLARYCHTMRGWVGAHFEDGFDPEDYEDMQAVTHWRPLPCLPATSAGSPLTPADD